MSNARPPPPAVSESYEMVEDVIVLIQVWERDPERQPVSFNEGNGERVSG